MRVKHVLRHLLPSKPAYPELPAGITVGPGTLLARGFHLEIRGNSQANRVTVGTDSVLQCHLTLERAVGTIQIGNNTFIGSSHLICAHHIEIGSDVLIAWGCTIMDHNSHSLRWSERAEDVRLWREGLQIGGETAAADLKNWDVVPMDLVRIEDKAWIGFNVLILRGVTIGKGAIIGAGSIVTKDIPPWTIAAGNPARVIRELSEDER